MIRKEEPPIPVKRAYVEPELIEYGSAAKLSQSATMGANDGITVQQCL